jgi:hypothetical protein
MSTTEPRLTRRALLRSAATLTVASALAGGGTVAYGYWAQRFGVRVDRVNVTLRTLPPQLNGLTVAHLSDFHHSAAVPLPYIEEVVGITNDLQPDLLVLTGDYIMHDSPDYALPCAAALGKLHAPLGRFAVLGNHDIWAKPRPIIDALASNGITVLRNDGLELQPGLWLLGVDDVWEHRDDLSGTFERLNPPAEAAKLLLAHEPDFADIARDFPIDLQLSGHSHGGQVRLPLLGAPRLPWLGERYPIGLAALDRLQVYTTRGIGVLDSMPFRFNCPPEITLLTLHAEGQS